MLQAKEKPVIREIIAQCDRCLDLVFIDALVSDHHIIKLFTNHTITQHKHIGVRHSCGGTVTFFLMN